MNVIGIDEVGRGCWAGPLVAGAAIIPKDTDLPPLLRDSKKLTAKQRTTVLKWITDNAMVGLGWVTPVEVDVLGLTKAVSTAMRRALQDLQQKHPHLAVDSIVIDGHINFLPDIPRTTAVIKADDSVPAVSAASIAAKVARDEYMQKIAQQLPDYGFDTHVGYGTASHIEALRRYGITAQHRLSYKPLQVLLGQYTSTSLGRLAETKAAKYLEEQDHQILAQNWHTRWCEIDIVSKFQQEIYFTEVKYRKRPKSGQGLEYITETKLKQMERAAISWLQAHDWQGSSSLGAIEVSGPLFIISSEHVRI